MPAEKSQTSEKEQQQYILDILDNTINKFMYDDTHYYLVVKSYRTKGYSMIILSDFDSHFWLQEIDYDFLLNIKHNMKLHSDLVTLAQHLANGLRKRVAIKSLGKAVKLGVPFEIGGHNGLLFNATITLRVHITEQQNFEKHYELMKSFFRHYEEAKEAQVNKMRQNAIKPLIAVANQSHDRKPKQTQVKQAQLLKVKQRLSEGGRDLINPLRQKRRPLGMKLVDERPQIANSFQSSDSESM